MPSLTCFTPMWFGLGRLPSGTTIRHLGSSSWGASTGIVGREAGSNCSKRTASSINRRDIRKIVVTDEADGGFAVVDVDTLWRDGEGRDNQWRGRACKVYTRMQDGEWKLIMHTGLLAY